MTSKEHSQTSGSADGQTSRQADGRKSSRAEAERGRRKDLWRRVWEKEQEDAEKRLREAREVLDGKDGEA